MPDETVTPTSTPVPPSPPAASTPTPPKAEQATLIPPAQPAVNPLEGVTHSQAKTMQELAMSNQQLLTKVSLLEQQLESARGRLLADGQVALTQADVEELNYLRRHYGGKDGVKALQTELETHKTNLSHTQKALLIVDSAEKVGFKREVLATLAKEVDLSLDEQGTPVVKVGEVVTPLVDYAAKQWAAFMPALKPETAPASIAVPPQFAGNTKAVGGDDVVSAHIEAQQKLAASKPNPLLSMTMNGAANPLLSNPFAAFNGHANGVK